jgi:hypothetical protein
MQNDSKWVSMRDVCRHLSRGMLLLVVFTLTQTVAAQQTEPMSPSVVLVLKLVSSTHVKPTTGIVISDNGLVLVPAEFAAGEGEMIVLDGGTDILSNGRPAQVHALTADGDLAVLLAKGLKRPGITLSENAWELANAKHLEAFPPAEYIAKGAQPIWLPLDVVSGVRPSVSSKTPLPYVSGAIIDNCGYLAGVSLSSGTQSLETTKVPRTLFTEALKPIFNQLQINLPSSSCEISKPLEKAPVAAAEPEPKVAEPEETPIEAVEISESEPIEADASKPSEDEVSDEAVGKPLTDPDLLAVTRVSENPSIWRSVPIWLPITGIIIMGALIWKALFYFKLHKAKPGTPDVASPTNNVQAASEEPVTAPLDPIEDDNFVKPRSAPAFDFEIPAMDTRPEGCDAVLVVEGKLDENTESRRFCFVNSKQINVVIGRGDADIAIEHAAISRRHARVESDGVSFTISDLESRNGTFIGDVPCLPGEVLYFETGNEIYLGDLKVTLRLVMNEAEWA